MKAFSRERAFLTALVTIMLAVLVTLGILQYRWSQQVSEADQTRLGDSLHSLLMDWHLDFFREFSAIAVDLQVGPDSGAHDNWRDYLQRYSEWRLTANYPALVDKILILESSQQDPRLLLLNPDKRIAEVYPARDDLQPLLNHLEQSAGSLDRATHSWMDGGEPPPPPPDGNVDHGSGGPPSASDSTTGWQFEPTTPALVHPIVHHALPGDLEQPEDPRRVDWIVMLLNAAVIEKQLLPDLSERYFAGSQGLAYEVAVVSGGNHPRVIYTSDLGFGLKQENSAEVTLQMFGPPPQSTEGHLWQSLKNGSAQSGRDHHHFSAPMWFPVLNTAGDTESWTLLLKNREGSLESLVAAARRRNLFLSFGVLSLLAIGMTMVVYASYRTQKLAKLQVDFVATVSHELRTPLSVIASAAENIADGVVEGKPQLIQYGSVIKDQTRQLAQLVEQILLFSAAREGGNRYTFSRLQVSSIVDSALRNTAGLIQVAGFTVERKVDPDLPEVNGDLAALTQCVQNLIGNAVKYGGESRWIRLSAQRAEGGVQISVEDRGIGIKASELGEIFEPFYRSDAVTSAQIRGTGLGLPLARSIAEAMGGSLTVKSELGRGSTFTLHLPALKREEAKENPIEQLK
ncbi:MAG TPA: HAMP domain-containing sensor histidine kinase [Terriglobales bacterium]|nr:HAMP domain-containing sensor histidine kinase [Terriglobales bacterium]